MGASGPQDGFRKDRAVRRRPGFCMRTLKRLKNDGVSDRVPPAGLVIGVCTFLIIGLFHPVVVKAEYYWGTRCWWVFLLLGLGGMAVSLLTDNVLLAALAGVFAFSSLWTIKELFEQRERVAKGWFPANPKRMGKKS